MIRERVNAGLARAKAEGKTLGRPRNDDAKQRASVLRDPTDQPSRTYKLLICEWSSYVFSVGAERLWTIPRYEVQPLSALGDCPVNIMSVWRTIQADNIVRYVQK
jgi:hypothetical protein